MEPLNNHLKVNRQVILNYSLEQQQEKEESPLEVQFSKLKFDKPIQFQSTDDVLQKHHEEESKISEEKHEKKPKEDIEGQTQEKAIQVPEELKPKESEPKSN